LATKPTTSLISERRFVFEPMYRIQPTLLFIEQS